MGIVTFDLFLPCRLTLNAEFQALTARKADESRHLTVPRGGSVSSGVMSPAVHVATNGAFFNQAHIRPAFQQLTSKWVNLILCR
jgi:hypothetical protein